MCCSEFHRKQPQESLLLVNTSFGDDGWCTCLGEDNDGNPIGYCCGYATQDDGLCDRCREHCQTEHHKESHTPAESVVVSGSPNDGVTVERHVEVAAVS